MFARLLSDDVNKSSLLQCLTFLAVMSLFFAFNSPAFFTQVNFGNILTASAVIGLMAVGSTFVIASGCIDLSTASVMALASVLCAAVAQNYHSNEPTLMAVATAVGALCGLVTGGLINITRAPSFIITLGMLSIYRALAFIFTGGIPIYGLDERVTQLAEHQWFGLSFPAIAMLAALFAGHLTLTHTKFGAHALLTGDNQNAAEAMGLNVANLRLGIFTSRAVFRD